MDYLAQNLCGPKPFEGNPADRGCVAIRVGLGSIVNLRRRFRPHVGATPYGLSQDRVGRMIQICWDLAGASATSLVSLPGSHRVSAARRDARDRAVQRTRDESRHSALGRSRSPYG